MGISQEEMSQHLLMDNRTYVELDHGRNCGNALTFAMYPLYISPDPKGFLQELKQKPEDSVEAM